jgi:membrane protease YdiL (CAAX protease family)
VHCGARFKEGAVFCEMCGAVRPSMWSAPPTSHTDWRTWALRSREYSRTQKRSSWRVFAKALMAFCVLTVVASLIMGAIALVYGVGLVTPYILDTGYDFALYVVLPVFVFFPVMSGYALLTYYYIVVAIIIACTVWVLLTSFKGFMKELTMKATPREHSAIFDIGGLVSVNAFMTFAILLVAMLFGASDTSGPSGGDLEELLFQLANAAVWEEVIIRILMIGLPLLVIDLVRRQMDRSKQAKNLPVAKRPARRWRQYILGGKFDIGVPEVALVVASASIFGYAHFLGGWGLWKIPAASIGGIAFGYLFLRHGLPAAIVMHFAVDYSGMPSQVFGYSDTIEVLLIIFWLGVGFVFTFYYLTRIGEFLTGRKLLEDRPVLAGAPWPQPIGYAPVQPQQYYYPPQNPQQMSMQPGPPAVEPQQAAYGGYVCPVCGYTEARYVNGRFQCLRCGNLT